MDVSAFEEPQHEAGNELLTGQVPHQRGRMQKGRNFGNEALLHGKGRFWQLRNYKGRTFPFLCPIFSRVEYFESCSPCSEDLNLSFCIGWEQTPASHVFVISECNQSMPSNDFGFQYPFEGKSYAALHVIDDARNVFNREGGNKTTFRSRGYMRMVLRKPLIQNRKYLFSCYLTLSERSAFSIEHLFIKACADYLSRFAYPCAP